MRTSWRMLKQVRRALAIAFVFSGCINLLMLATPLYTLQIFESVVPFDSLETLAVLTGITAIAILACALIEIARDMVLLRSSVWLDHELGRHILENGLKLGTPPAELKLDSRALSQVKSFIASGAVTPLFDAPFTPIFLLALAALHPMIGAVGLASSLLLLLAALLQGLATGRVQREGATATERAERWWMTVAGSGQLAGSLGLSRGASEQWERFNRWQVVNAYSLGKRASMVKALGRAIRIGSQIALYAVGATLVIRSELAPGALVASAILLARALAPLEQLVAAMKVAHATHVAYRRLKSLPADASVPRVADGDGPRGDLTIADASLYYPTRKTPALRAVSLRLAAGECLGIVGPNGSGKTTLAALIAGAMAPTSGAVDLDGIPVAKWQRGDCEPPVGYMPDEPALLDGTVHENIARFSDASLVTVARAAMRAGVHDTIQALQQGYATPVGPHGSGLALRERRAVAMARAVFGSPRIVVLDEPEIGLDGASIRQLLKVLRDLKDEGVALVLATQDPRLLALTDKIVVLNGGAVQTIGPTAELSRRLDGDRRPAPEHQQSAGLH